MALTQPERLPPAEEHAPGVEVPGPEPEWVIMGFRDPHGLLVIASSDVSESRYLKRLTGYEDGPEVRGRKARLPVWQHTVGLRFRRATVIRGSNFREALVSLAEQWRPPE